MMGTHKNRAARFGSNVWTAAAGPALISLALAILTVAPTAQAQTFTVLESFAGLNGTNPNPHLVLDAAGNLYGTTFYGGSYGDYGPGTVFRLSRHGSAWLLTTLHDFSGRADGGMPWGGVTFGPDGALYGTTWSGGVYGWGVVYKLQPPIAACRTAPCPWHETVLYNFTGASDGGNPQGDLVFDRAGNLYGAAARGGLGYGLVYRLALSQGSWTETVVHAFAGASDGAYPQDGVVLDQAGNVYGMTTHGGANSLGVVYELSYGIAGWTETVLHDFAGGSDGQNPCGLSIDSAGDLFGETNEAGAFNDGTVFELQPANGVFNYTIILNFEPQMGGPGFVTALTPDNAGNLYGSNSGGGQGNGVAFELTPSGGTWNFTTLHDFTYLQGTEVEGKPTLDAQGNIYGTADNGGPDAYGTVWEITP